MENKEQQYKNLTLISINNTLHIKADNLEPVEVDSSCVDGILLSIDHKIPQFSLSEGINISELSDRIQIVRYVNCPVGSPKAFLIPEKEDKETIKTFTITQTELTGVLINGVRYYPIEEIEKAIDGVKLVPHYDEILKIIKKQILNNLKKLTNTY